MVRIILIGIAIFISSCKKDVQMSHNKEDFICLVEEIQKDVYPRLLNDIGYTVFFSGDTLTGILLESLNFQKVPSSLYDCRFMRKVSLLNNNIKNINVDSFSLMKNLNYLNLSENVFNELPDFTKLDRLTDLVIYGNKAVLHNSCIKLPTSIKSLSINGNHLKTFKIDKPEALKNLESIDISFNNLDRLDSSVLSLPKLGILHISNNSFPEYYIDSLSKIYVNIKFLQVAQL